jgi:hypothetical protein
MSKLLFLLVFLPTTLTSLAAAPMSSMVTYNLFRNGIQLGVITEHFEVKDGKYQAVSEGRATGLLALAQREPVRYFSSGAITSEGLKPARFEARHAGKFALAEFDWPGAKLNLTHDGLSHALAMPANTQDRLSIMYQIHHSLSAKTQPIDLAMTNGRKIERYRYIATSNVTIDTPFKRLNTTHLIKQLENSDDTRTEIWVAPEYGNIAARVLIVESDGVKYEQIATRIEVRR